MHIHILGIGGTFMGGVALLARAAGHTISGADGPVYPPMSTQLAAEGIDVYSGYAADQLTQVAPDQIVVGNAMRRGLPVVESMLNQSMNYISGPQWLAENILREHWVLAVAGTHGKTTTASLLAHILEYAGLSPGFLIGGVPKNFGVSARLTESPFFVVEADEYDTAFFDKRSKFVHYHPRTLILNNIEFDHADIFSDIEAIKQQFHQLVRTVPGNGLIIGNASDDQIQDTLSRGCWTPTEDFDFANDGVDKGWRVRMTKPDGSHFQVLFNGEIQGEVNWNLLGYHNVSNALAALLAARHAGVPITTGMAALPSFAGVARRLEMLGDAGGVYLYDDFAHHPTAIAATLNALRAHIGTGNLVAVVEPRSNTMRMGKHEDGLASAFKAADKTWFYQPPDIDWSLEKIVSGLGQDARVARTIDELANGLIPTLTPGDHVVFMSNGSFDGLPRRIQQALTEREV